MLGLRKGEKIPAWITHVLDVEGDTAVTKKNDSSFPSTDLVNKNQYICSSSRRNQLESGQLIADLKNVNVSYGERKVHSTSVIVMSN